MKIRKQKVVVIFFALLAILFNVSCGGGGSGNDDENGNGSGGFKLTKFWCVSTDTRSVRLISWPAGNIEKDFDYTPVPTSVARNGEDLWVSTNEGKLLKIDPATGDILKSLDIGQKIEKIIISDNTLWANDSGGTGPSSTRDKIIKVDLGTETVSESLGISTVNVNYDDIIVSGGYLYVLIGNAFAIAKIDIKTDAVIFLKEIGESGGYGYGAFAIDGTTAWIVDDYNNTIIEFDLTNNGTIVSRNSIPAASYDTLIFYDGSLYISRLDSEDIAQIDLTSFEATPVTTEITPKNIYLNGDYIIVLGSDFDFGKVEDIDLSTLEISHSSTGVYVDTCEMMD